MKLLTRSATVASPLSSPFKVSVWSGYEFRAMFARLVAARLDPASGHHDAVIRKIRDGAVGIVSQFHVPGRLARSKFAQGEALAAKRERGVGLLARRRPENLPVGDNVIVFRVEFRTARADAARTVVVRPELRLGKCLRLVAGPRIAPGVAAGRGGKLRSRDCDRRNGTFHHLHFPFSFSVVTESASLIL